MKMSKTDIEYLASECLVWRCNLCAQERRKRLMFKTNAAESKLSLEDIMKVVCEIREKQNKAEKD